MSNVHRGCKTVRRVGAVGTVEAVRAVGVVEEAVAIT